MEPHITKGISILNPVNIDADYLSACANYAMIHGIRHLELIGPTHSPIRGNCDGMILYRKYANCNEGKDIPYIRYCEKTVNAFLDQVTPHGIRCYYWHHELELPLAFDRQYPEICNAHGDVEVTHPRIRDFLVSKIEDFFASYPKMSGIVLTLHETRIPILKLKHQKLDRVQRVRYITEILYETCKRLGKELIVRPFASIAADYDDLMNAYEQISDTLPVCDKWTKYDWSLVRPHNPFLARIRNPLIVEADIFGEYFGKGFLPLMLKDHITEKIRYCSRFPLRGYVARIDREGFTAFGTPNEVNLAIMDAAIEGNDIDTAIDVFFSGAYGDYGKTVRAAMENTEALQIKALHVKDRTLHWLSRFPPLFIMKKTYRIFRDDCTDAAFAGSDGSSLFSEVHRNQTEAIKEIEEKLSLIRSLYGKIEPAAYHGLYMRFRNFYLTASIFEALTQMYYALARFFEHHDTDALPQIYEAIDRMVTLDRIGYEELGAEFYCEALALGKNSPFRRYGIGNESDAPRNSQVYRLKSELQRTLETEIRALSALQEEEPFDYVVAGGFSEEHNMRCEPNFSAALTMEDGICRTAGSERGAAWSLVKSHGWFSYVMHVRPESENTIRITGKGEQGTLSFDLTVDQETSRHRISGDGILTVERRFWAVSDSVTVRIDRNSEFLPFIYTVSIL
jgi:hypothetical protein